MPLIIPTPDEVQRMDARQRAAWRKRMGLTMRQAKESIQLLTLGEVIREDAKRLEALMEPDPDAARHQHDLLMALR